jgi:hypothetical protein
VTTQKKKDFVCGIIKELQALLRNTNSYIRDYVTLHERIKEEEWLNYYLYINADKRPDEETHPSVRNVPKGLGLKEISVMYFDDPTRAKPLIAELKKRQSNRHLELQHQRDPNDIYKGIRTIDETHRGYDPMHFVLLFPNGEDGWHLEIPREEKRKRIPTTVDNAADADIFGHELALHMIDSTASAAGKSTTKKRT